MKQIMKSTANQFLNENNASVWAAKLLLNAIKSRIIKKNVCNFGNILCYKYM